MTPAAVERAQCDAQWIGDLDSDEVERARQEIPPATRRKVLHRDQERCTVPGCRCHTNLDVHHIVHREHGGTNELSNLTVLCESHHLAHHEGTLVIERVGGELRFRREGRNNFTRATREVATRQALRDRGYDRDQIAEIMRRTVTHVGANDLSAEQWLAIALRYAERSPHERCTRSPSCARPRPHRASARRRARGHASSSSSPRQLASPSSGLMAHALTSVVIQLACAVVRLRRLTTKSSAREVRVPFVAPRSADPGVGESLGSEQDEGRPVRPARRPHILKIAFQNQRSPQALVDEHPRHSRRA